MKFIINENKVSGVISKIIKSYYGDVEMTIDEDKYINFFSEKEIDYEGYPKRIFHRNNYGTLWVDHNFFTYVSDLTNLNTDIISDGIMNYIKDEFGIPVKQVNVEF
jgi:hypothetical protein